MDFFTCPINDLPAYTLTIEYIPKGKTETKTCTFSISGCRDRLYTQGEEKRIFFDLDFSYADIRKFADKAFGYPCELTEERGDRLSPKCRYGDYAALRRYGKALLDLANFTFKPKVEYNSTVIFQVGGTRYTYRVCTTHLAYGNGNNQTIFKVLGLDKKAFCTQHYGYAVGDQDWPDYKYEDFAAASRVIDALQEECRKFNEPKVAEPVEEKLNLRVNSVVTIGPCTYTVKYSYLVDNDNPRGGDNDRIFTYLGVNKFELAKQMYGYELKGGSWPEFKYGDYAAAQRLVEELQRLCLLKTQNEKNLKPEYNEQVSKSATSANRPSELGGNPISVTTSRTTTSSRRVEYKEEAVRSEETARVSKGSITFGF